MSESSCTIVIVSPVYNDWDSASLLCRALDEVWASALDCVVHVVLVDDGSAKRLDGWQAFAPRALRSIRMLPLVANIGHQRAIAAGLCHVQETLPCNFVIVMDADGEDRPEDTLTLAMRARAEPATVVFAVRRKRFERGTFRVGYFLYRLIHRALTGVSVRVGNFSALPASALPRLTVASGIWSHYAGAVFRSKLALGMVALDRGRRYHGRSHMSVVSLVIHGLAGIASFQDVVATRLLLGSVLSASVAGVCLVAVALVRFSTQMAIPGWATYVTGFLVTIILVMIASSFNLVFTLIAARGQTQLVPIRDYRAFVGAEERLS